MEIREGKRKEKQYYKIFFFNRVYSISRNYILYKYLNEIFRDMREIFIYYINISK